MVEERLFFSFGKLLDERLQVDIEEVGLFSKALAHTNKNRVIKGDLVE